uniref:Uncharacterized protein n=1 Tax=Arion vulgaris TaxID=1028688 RepID=A0A0B6Z914_9EUPU
MNDLSHYILTVHLTRNGLLLSISQYVHTVRLAIPVYVTYVYTISALLFQSM